MRLDSGPIPQISYSGLDATIEDPGFSVLVQEWLAQVQPLEAELDIWIDPLAAIDAALPPDTILADLDDANALSLQASAYVDPAQFGGIDAAQTAGVAGIINAYQSTPGEAFIPAPLPIAEGGGPPPLPSIAASTLTLNNTTRPGAATFNEGEAYEIDIHFDNTGPKLVQYYQVSVEWIVSGLDTPGPHIQLGQTDLNGNLKYTGIFDSTWVGTWQSQFIATTTDGIEGVSGNLNWSVLPSSDDGGTGGTGGGGTGAALVRVALYVNMQPSQGVMHVGDHYTLQVWGPAKSPILISGNFNGGALAPLVIGSTDETGHFELDATVTVDQLGQWNEYYNVGGFQWNDSLNFAVIPGV